MPTLTERNKIPALSSEIPAGSLMRRVALQFWNQLRSENKKPKCQSKTRHGFRTNMGGMKRADLLNISL